MHVPGLRVCPQCLSPGGREAAHSAARRTGCNSSAGVHVDGDEEARRAAAKRGSRLGPCLGDTRQAEAAGPLRSARRGQPHQPVGRHAQHAALRERARVRLRSVVQHLPECLRCPRQASCQHAPLGPADTRRVLQHGVACEATAGVGELDVHLVPVLDLRLMREQLQPTAGRQRHGSKQERKPCQFACFGGAA